MFLHLGFQFFFSGTLATHGATTWHRPQAPLTGGAQ